MSYRPQLDSIRAVAIGLVLLHHFLPLHRYVSEDFFSLGLLGVRLFFVLSGFLITGILLQYRTSRFSDAARQFYFRRALRIFPIYYLTLKHSS